MNEINLSIIFVTTISVLFYFYIRNRAITEGITNHMKFIKTSYKVNYMHSYYNVERFLIGLLVIVFGLHRFVVEPTWEYYLAAYLIPLLMFVPIHDGYFYLTRNKWANLYDKDIPYPGGFWNGKDSHPGNHLTKLLNQPTIRWALLMAAIFVYIVISTLHIK